jgi:hypothetical protein
MKSQSYWRDGFIDVTSLVQMLIDQILVEIAMVDQTDRFNDLAGRPHRWDLDWGFLPMTSFN